MAPTTGKTAESETLARRYIEAIERHDGGRIEGLEEMVAEDVVNHSPVAGIGATPEVERGIEAFRRHAEAIPAAFPDVRFEIEDVIAAGDRAAVRLVLRGTHEGPFLGVDPTGAAVAMSAIVVYRFEDGKIAERWSEGNTLGLLQQLGVRELPAAA